MRRRRRRRWWRRRRRRMWWDHRLYGWDSRTFTHMLSTPLLVVCQINNEINSERPVPLCVTLHLWPEKKRERERKSVWVEKIRCHSDHYAQNSDIREVFSTPFLIFWCQINNEINSERRNAGGLALCLLIVACGWCRVTARLVLLSGGCGSNWSAGPVRSCALSLQPMAAIPSLIHKINWLMHHKYKSEISEWRMNWFISLLFIF